MREKKRERSRKMDRCLLLTSPHIPTHTQTNTHITLVLYVNLAKVSFREVSVDDRGGKLTGERTLGPCYTAKTTEAVVMSQR